MWFRTLFEALNRGRARTPARPARRGDARSRSVACPLGVESLGDRIVPASLSVGDATVIEGNAGTQYAEVRVTLDAPTNKTVTVNYVTANGTALAVSDYDAASGGLRFAPGETVKTIRIAVRGDRLGEADETFSVKLQAAKNAKISGSAGIVTILDDEPRISITGDAAYEGHEGSRFLTFTVTLSAASNQTVTVNYATQDGTAIAGEDYLATSGTLIFAPGETTKTITVEILADTTPEPDETFYVLLSDASANASIAAFFYASGGILDDDGYPGEPCDPTTGGCSTE